MPKKKCEPKAPPQAERPQFTGLDLEDDEDETDTTIHDDVVWLTAKKAKPKGDSNGQK